MLCLARYSFQRKTASVGGWRGVLTYLDDAVLAAMKKPARGGLVDRLDRGRVSVVENLVLVVPVRLESHAAHKCNDDFQYVKHNRCLADVHGVARKNQN